VHDIDLYDKQVKQNEKTTKDIGFVYYKRENGRLIPYKN